MTPSDLSLVNRWTLDRDAEAFNEIISRHTDMVYGTCRRVLGDATDAEDVAQECFLELARADSTISVSLGGWLHTLATRKAINFMRAAARRRSRELGYEQSRERVVEPDWEDIEPHVDEAIASLPEDSRQVLVAHFLERKTHDSIARELGLSRSTVTRRVARAVKLVRVFLEKRGVALTLTSLAALMTSGMAEAAPGSLTALLGKVALSGVKGAGSGGTFKSALGGVLVMKAKTTTTLAAVALLFIPAALYLTWDTAVEEDPEYIDTVSFESPEPVEGREPITNPARPDVALTSTDPDMAQSVEEAPKAQIVLAALALSGRVLDDQENPVSGARIEAICTGIDDKDWKAGDWSKAASLGTANHATVSQSDGAFVLTGMCPPGVMLLQATATGYVPHRERLDFPSGTASEPVVLRLVPAPIEFSGRVLQPSGAPVSDAYVEIKTWGSSAKTRISTWAYTDVQGRFSLSCADEALVALQVVSETFGRQSFSDVLVQDGGFVELRFLSQPTILHGAISWKDGSPASGALVRLTGDLVQLQYDAEGQPTGGYSSNAGDTLDIPVGSAGYYRSDEVDPGQSYRVHVIDSDGQDLSPSVRLNELNPGAENRWDTVLTNAIALHVTVRGETKGRSIPNITVSCAKLDTDLSTNPGAVSVAITDADGQCDLVIASGPGTYGLRAVYNSSGLVMTGPETQYDLEFQLRNQDIDITLKIREEARFRCLVIDANGAPIFGAIADTLVHRNSGVSSQTFRVASTGIDGRLEVMVEPDTVVQCILRHEGYSSARTLEYVFEPGADWEETVVLYPSASLTARLLDPNDAALANVSVLISVIMPDGKERTITLETDENGELLIEEDVPAARIALRIQATVEINGSPQELVFRSGEFDVVGAEVNDLGTIRLGLVEPQA